MVRQRYGSCPEVIFRNSVRKLAYISKEEAKVLREQATSCQRLVLGLIKHFNRY
jgi:hypothetical protein